MSVHVKSCAGSTCLPRLAPQAVAKLKRLLPADAVLVGQSCASDIEWMMLEKGVDFAEAPCSEDTTN